MAEMRSMNGILTMINIPMNLENTYKDKDGLPRCKNCHTLRVTENIIPVFEKRMPVMCKCQEEAEQKAKEKEEYDRKMRMLDKLRSASLLGERYRNATFDNTDLSVGGEFEKAFHRCRKFCEIADKALEEGYGIYLYGNSGTGKTHLTACICNELIDSYRQCLFTNFLEVSKLIRSTYGRNTDAEGLIKRICDIDFLFIDDLGTEILKKNGEDSWLQEQVFDIINKRYNNRKPTIFSSNYSLNELIEQRGMMEKTVDRIMEMATAIIRVNGASYRAKNRRKESIF